ncbi:hypothetical protein PMAYCL1PPCAC_14671, partial [Pristionchus mayeri]
REKEEEGGKVRSLFFFLLFHFRHQFLLQFIQTRYFSYLGCFPFNEKFILLLYRSHETLLLLRSLLEPSLPFFYEVKYLVCFFLSLTECLPPSTQSFFLLFLLSSFTLSLPFFSSSLFSSSLFS